MIIGAHMIITSKNPKADHAFLREVLKLPHVDDGGYLIFGLPPSEVSVHQADKNGGHELFLMCDDVQAFVVEMNKRNVSCNPVADQGWGLLTQIQLPGGGKLAVYEPRHARPQAAAPKRRVRGKK
ncbi:MAG TPA: hypothetical protein VGT43_10590 [Burkholderiales bacterium]|nr:hypothetical protein [Burkholderiales bacterium]